MKFFVVLALVSAAAVVVESQSEVYTPPARECEWSVEMTFHTSNGFAGRFKYYINGRYLAKEYFAKENDDTRTLHAVYRPDLSNRTFIHTGKNCTEIDSERSVLWWATDRNSINAISRRSSFTSKESATYNGKKCTKYIRTSPTTGEIILFVFVDSDNVPIALSSDIVTGAIADLKFDSSAPLSVFTLDKDSEGGCKDDSYKSGDEEHIFCAASTAQVAVALLLAAVSAALLLVF